MSVKQCRYPCSGPLTDLEQFTGNAFQISHPPDWLELTQVWTMNKYFGAVSLTDLTRTLVQSVAPAIQTSGRHETFNSTGTAYCFVAMENYP